MKHPKRTSSWRALPVVLVLVVLILASCSIGGDDGESAAVFNPEPLGAPAAEEFGDFDEFAPAPTAAPAAAPAALDSGGTALPSLQPLTTGRDIIFRADLTVAVTDVAAAGTQATTLVEALGGFLFGQQTTGGPQPQSFLTFKIQPETFQTAVDQLGALGEIRSQNISADDVTDRVVDLESRITTAEASVDRLREFLAEASTLNTIADLERELLDRETTLETLRGQLRTVEGQVALATIVLFLTEEDIAPDMFVRVSTYLGHEDAGQSCPGEGEQGFVEGDDVTVCFEIINTGDTSLTEFTLRDSVLEVEFDDLIKVFGDPAEILETGQNLVLAVEVVVDRDIRTRTRVTAEPVKEETGEVITGRTVSRTETSFIFAEDPGGLPGFRDGLSASWEFLQDLGGLVVLAAGGILPFVWLLALAALYVWLRRRRKAQAGDSGPEDLT